METATPKPTGWKVMHVAATDLETALNQLTTEGWFVFKVFQDESDFPALGFTIICREKNRSAAWAMKYELTKIRKSIRRTENMQVEANATIDAALAAQNKRFTDFINQAERELALGEPSPASPLLADAPPYGTVVETDDRPETVDDLLGIGAVMADEVVGVIVGETDHSLIIEVPRLEADQDFAPHTGTVIADLEATVSAHDGSGVQGEGDIFTTESLDEPEGEGDALLDETEVDELVNDFFTANAPEPEPVSSAPIDDAAKLDNLFADRSDSNTSGLLGL